MDAPSESAIDVSTRWWRVCDSSALEGDGRLHTSVEGRFITVFRYRGQLSAIDSVCHHAGGPMTDGVIQDIEELGVSVVLCPWHRFMVSIDSGLKVFQGIEIVNGAPVNTGWKLGKVVQRPHRVIERPDGIYVSLVVTEEACTSDKDAMNERCGRQFKLHPIEPTLAAVEP